MAPLLQHLICNQHIIRLLILAFLTSGFSCPAICHPHTDSKVMQQPVPDRTLIVRGDYNYPPFEFINKNGEPDGFNVELFKAIASELNISYELKLEVWSKVRNDLETGAIDVALGLMISPARAEKMTFGLPHSSMTHGIFTHKSKNFKTLEELAGKEIIVQNKDLMHDYLLETNLTTQIITVGSQLDALMLLATGKHDAALLGNFQGMNLIKEHKIKDVAIRSSGIEPQKYAMAVPKDKEELIWLLNNGIYQMKENGTYDRLYEKWFAVYEGNYFLRNNRTLIFIIAAFIVVLIAFVLLLRFQVRRATLSLKVNEERFRRLVQNTNDLTAILDTRGAFTYISPSIKNILGYEVAEMAGKELAALLHPDDQALIGQTMNALTMTPDQSAQQESRMKHKDGSWRYVDVFLQNSVNDKAISGIIINARDVTRRKQMLEQLKKSEQHYRSFFEMDISGDYLSTPDGKLLDCNPTFVQILGYDSKEELLNIHTDRLYRQTSDRSSFLDNLRKHKNLINSELDLVRKDGTLIHCIENVVGTFSETGELIHFQGYLLDITSRKKDEEKLRFHAQLFKMAGKLALLGSFSVNLETNRVYWSDEVAEIHEMPHGYSPTVEEGFGFYEPECLNKITEVFRACAEQGIPYDEELQIITSKGKRVWIRTIGVAEYNKSGKIISVQGAFQDISEKKKSENELRRAFENWNKTFDAIQDGIALLDKEQHIVLSNQAFNDFVGTNDFTEFQCLHFVHSTDCPIDNCPFERMQLSKSRESMEMEINGRPCLIVVDPILNDAGEITGAVHIISDISESKKSEALIRHNEERFRLLVKNVSSIIVAVDANGVQKYISPAVEKITGYKPEEVTGKSLSEIIHPDDLPQVMSAWEEGFGIPDKILTVQYRHIHKTQGWVYLEGIGQSFLHEPAVRAVIVSVRDISEQRRTEILRKIQYNIAHAVVSAKNTRELFSVVRKELNQIVDTTNFFVAFYNEKSRMLRNAFWADEKEHFEEWPAEKSLSGIVVTEGKPLFLTKNDITALAQSRGIELWGTMAEFWMGVPLIIRNKVIGTMVVQSYDTEYAIEKYSREVLEIIANQISLYIEKLRDEEELVKAIVRVEQSDKLKTSFLRNMSHEIRTPLNGIMGFSSLLNEPDKLTKEEVKSFTSLVYTSSNRLMAIVDDVMEISRIESGLTRTEMTVIRLKDILMRLNSHYEPIAREKDVAFRLNLPEELALISLHTDKDKLHLILRNLLNNAIKFTFKGSIELTVSKTDGGISISVKDTGIGIEEVYHEKIFERFWQHEAFTKEFYGGTGLGLPIAKGLAELLKCKIAVNSTFGEGSTFTLHIPESCITGENTNGMPAGKIQAHASHKIQDLKVLIAEDDLSNYIYIEKLLAIINVKIAWVTDGRQAVEKAKKERFDLILMDLKMPVMSGFEAIEKIREFDKKTPIIALTAYSLFEDRDKALESGSNDFMSKPVNKADLINKIHKFCLE